MFQQGDPCPSRPKNHPKKLLFAIDDGKNICKIPVSQKNFHMQYLNPSFFPGEHDGGVDQVTHVAKVVMDVLT